MQSLLQGIPDIKKYPLHYIFEDFRLKHEPETLWLEFGVASGRTINYISTFTDQTVYGFDSFQGLPEKWRDEFDKGAFNMDGVPPQVHPNVQLIQGWFQDTLVDFLQGQSKKIGFVHVDCDLYSSTKYILDTIKPYLANECVVLFDELVNYPGFDGDNGELRALHEFITENDDIRYKWLGMNGTPLHMTGYEHENVAIILLK